MNQKAIDKMEEETKGAPTFEELAIGEEFEFFYSTTGIWIKLDKKKAKHLVSKHILDRVNPAILVKRKEASDGEKR